MPLAPHQFWQTIDTAGDPSSDAEGWRDFYPAALPDGRVIALPIRVLPGDGRSAVASLIVNQASFVVEDALSSSMADLLAPYQPEVIVGVPTLGLPLANNVARRLGHSRMVALGTSRKFWYDDDLSAPLSSITSPDQQKTIYLDPRMLDLLAGKRIAVIDDVVSSGTSMAAVLRLLQKAYIAPAVIAVAMLQGTRWQQPLAAWSDRIVAPVRSPRLSLSENGWWHPGEQVP